MADPPQAAVCPLMIRLSAGDPKPHHDTGGDRTVPGKTDLFGAS